MVDEDAAYRIAAALLAEVVPVQVEEKVKFWIVTADAEDE
jgi:hypothetical protein